MNTFSRITGWARTRLRVSEPGQAEGAKMAYATGATEAVNGVKVAIKGLKDWQCEELEGIKVGSLLEVTVFERIKQTGAASQSDGDGASDDERSGEGSDEDDEENEANGSDSSDVLEPTELLGGQYAPDDMNMDEFVQLASRNAVDGRQSEQSASEVSKTESLEGATSGMNGDGTSANDVETTQEDGLLEGTPNLTTSASDDQLDEESENESRDDEGEGESEQDDENEGVDEDDDQDAEDEEDEVEPMRQVSRELYVVLSVTTKDGDNSTITDVHLRNLSYQNRGSEAEYDTYRIFGNTISLEDGSATLQDGEESRSVAEAIASEPDNEYAIVLNPGGDQLRRTLFGFLCPGRCNRGWLPDQAALQGTISDEVETLRHYRPVCPVCVGKDLMNEQMLLRSLLDAQHIVDIGMVVEYLGRLNPRRRQLGYSFVQFDEREWGYGFDDMLDESGSERDDGDGAGQYEHWDEAMDPNANPKTRPASKDTVAALPRKTYVDVVKKEDGAFCAICQEGVFEEESSVVELPCGHVYDEGCLEAWISSYDNCPECRATVSGMVGQKEEVETGDGDEAQEDELLTTTQATTALTGAGEQDAMDGEDTIMSDAIIDQAVPEAA